MGSHLDELPSLDLSDLYESPFDPRIATELDAALSSARAIGDRADHAFISLDTAVHSLATLEDIERTLSRLSGYCEACNLLDVTNVEAGALSNLVAAASAEIKRALLPLVESWHSQPDPAAQALLHAPELHRWRSWLRRERVAIPQSLHPRSRHAICEMQDAAMSALGQTRNQLIARLKVPIKDCRHVPLAEAQTHLYDPDSERRRRAEESIGVALEGLGPLVDGLLGGVIRIRRATANALGCVDASALRNHEDDIETPLVEGLMSNLAEQRGLAQRAASLRSRVLGTSVLLSSDRMSPLDSSPTKWDWSTAWEQVRSSVGKTVAGMDKFADLALAGGRIHVRPLHTQRDGAGTLSVGDLHGARLVMRFGGTQDDVLVLAHELGHLLHLDLAARNGPFAMQISPIVAETIALVFETCVLRDILLDEWDDPLRRLHAHVQFLDRVMGNTFKQTAHNRFEELMHLGSWDSVPTRDHWVDAHRWVYGDTLFLSQSFAWSWAQIPHFVHVPFYCRIYAVAQMSALEILQAFDLGRINSTDFIAVMQAGASEAPSELLFQLGIRNQSDAWEGAIQILRGVLDSGEALADEVIPKVCHGQP
jgi:oligoendopeptidase F